MAKIECEVSIKDIDIFQDLLTHSKHILEEIFEKGLADEVKTAYAFQNWINDVTDKQEDELASIPKPNI